MSANVPAACVIGWPVEHSRSPLIHNYWLRKYGIAGEYRHEAVPPEDFAAFVRSLGERGYVGANVTVPHKDQALALSQPDESAQAIGVANTLWLEDGVLRSTNTDAEGFLANLDAAVPGWGQSLSRAVVLGAGGAAHAVIYGLLTRGADAIAVANRTTSRAERLRQRFGARVLVVPWPDREIALAGAQLLVNTTTLGMSGQGPLSLDLANLPDDAAVCDLIYAPLVTPLLRAARAKNLRTADGLGMLLHQAVRGFALWFKRTPELTAELRVLIEADLGHVHGSQE